MPDLRTDLEALRDEWRSWQPQDADDRDEVMMQDIICACSSRLTALLAQHPGASSEQTHAGNPDVYPKVGVTSRVVGTVQPAAPNLREMADALRGITHPNEGPCPVCGHIFDAHRDGCPYDAIDLAIDAALAAATEPKAGEYRCDSCGPDVPTRLCCNICGRPLEGPRIHGSLDERRKGGEG